MKPLPPTRLKAGQAIGAADKLVDTFNWLVDATENLKGDGCFIYVNKSNPEVPEIELDIDSLQDFLAGQISGLSGGSCSCEMSADLSDGTKIGSFTNDGWQTQVDLYAPSSLGGCSCDLSAELTSGTKIAAWTKDGWRTHTDIYAPSGGGDVSSYTTLSGNVPGSQKIFGDVVFEAMTSSNVSVETVV